MVIEVKKKKLAMWIGVFVVVLIGIAVALNMVAGADQMISIYVYDAQGNEIPADIFSVLVVGPYKYEGAETMKIEVSVDNTGDLPLDVRMTSITPTQIDSQFIKLTKRIDSGQTATWISGFIYLDQFEEQSITSVIEVTGTYQYAGTGHDIVKTGSVTFAVEADPIAGFVMDVSIGDISTTANPCTTEGSRMCENTGNYGVIYECRNGYWAIFDNGYGPYDLCENLVCLSNADCPGGMTCDVGFDECY